MTRHATATVDTTPTIAELARQVYARHGGIVTAGAIRDLLDRIDETGQMDAFKESGAKDLFNRVRLQQNQPRWSRAEGLRRHLRVERPPSGYRPLSAPAPVVREHRGAEVVINPGEYAAMREVTKVKVQLDRIHVECGLLYKPDVERAKARLEQQASGNARHAELLGLALPHMRDAERLIDTVRRLEQGAA